VILTVYRCEQAYSLSAEEVLRVAAPDQFVAAWDGPLPPEAGSRQLGFALGQPVLAREPAGLLGAGRLRGVSASEEGQQVPPPRHLVLLQACDGDVRHAVWADGLDWQPGAMRPSLVPESEQDLRALG
jgi:hypothetical protein